MQHIILALLAIDHVVLVSVELVLIALDVLLMLLTKLIYYIINK